jgi:integrase
MATVAFKIYQTPEGKKASIFAVLRISQAIRPEINTGEHVYPRHWGNGRVKGGPDKIEINLHLNQIEKDLLQMWRENPTADKATITELARRIVRGDSVQKKTDDTTENPVLHWMKEYIKLTKKKKGTSQVYNATVEHLTGWAKKNKVTITWDTFNLTFYDSFLEYLYSLGHNDNTVGKYIKKAKNLISEGFERDQHVNINFKKKAFKAMEAEVDEIYLSESEIIKIYNLNIPELENVKKRFVFSCWVGLRFGDISKLSPHQFQKGLNGPILRVLTEKTNEEVLIPLHPIAEEIWLSWQTSPPKPISNPEFNEKIKTLAEKAGLNDMVQKRNTIRGEVTIQWVPKHTMVKAHTTRRSFATNCVLMKKMPNKTIMAITGHKTEKAFFKYVRITKAQHAELMAEAFKEHVQEQQAKMQVNRETVNE